MLLAVIVVEADIVVVGAEEDTLLPVADSLASADAVICDRIDESVTGARTEFPYPAPVAVADRLVIDVSAKMELTLPVGSVYSTGALTVELPAVTVTGRNTKLFPV